MHAGSEPVPFRAPPERQGQAVPSALLRELFPAGVAAYELHGLVNPAELPPEEQACAGRASLKSAHEFAAGRLCARAALKQLGIAGFPVTPGGDSSPQWPPQVCGSIVHTRRYCAAAVAERSRFKALGLDAEPVAEMSREIPHLICSPAEAAWLGRLPQEERARMVSLILSAKEAFYKCQYSITRQWMAFGDISLDLAGWELGAGSFVARPLGASRQSQGASPWLGRFRFWEGLVICGVALPAD